MNCENCTLKISIYNVKKSLHQAIDIMGYKSFVYILNIKNIKINILIL